MKKLLSLFLVAAIMVPSLLLPVAAHEIIPPSHTEEGMICQHERIILEDDSCPLGHYRPNGYIYAGYDEGDSYVEGLRLNGVLNILGSIPFFGDVVSLINAAIIGNDLYNYLSNGNRILTRYFIYRYTNGESYWNHIVWVYDRDDDGWPDYLSCKVITGDL